MATATDPSYQVRQGLVSKGVNPGDIGYKNGYVTVGGNNFMQPSKVLNGVSYDSQQNFDNAWNNYQKSLNKTPSTSTAGTTGYSSGTPSVTPNVTPYSPYNTNNPYDSQYNTLLSSLLQQAQNPTPIDVNQIYASPQYAAYQAQAQKGAQQATRAAQESLGASGFGRSSTLAERAQANQNDANTYLNTQVLPALMAQAQQEQQQQYSNLYNILGQLGSQQGVYDNRFNNANDLAISKGQLTGSYIDPQAASLIDAILREKQNYGAATDAAGRDQARANAEAYRSQLAGLGYDPSVFGADRTLQQAQAGRSTAGVPTLAAQNQQFNQDMANKQFDRGVKESDRAYEYQKARDSIEDKRYQQQFDENVRQYGLDYALRKAQSDNQLSQFWANYNQNADQFQKTLDSKNAADAPKDTYTPTQIGDIIKQNYKDSFDNTWKSDADKQNAASFIINSVSDVNQALQIAEANGISRDEFVKAIQAQAANSGN